MTVDERRALFLAYYQQVHGWLLKKHTDYYGRKYNFLLKPLSLFFIRVPATVGIIEFQRGRFIDDQPYNPTTLHSVNLKNIDVFTLGREIDSKGVFYVR